MGAPFGGDDRGVGREVRREEGVLSLVGVRTHVCLFAVCGMLYAVCCMLLAVRCVLYAGWVKGSSG